MTPLEQRNEQLAQTIIKNLKRRHMEGFYCATAEEAVRKVSELIEDGSSVTWGGTMTVRDMGIPQYLKDRGTLEVLDRDLAATPEEAQAIYLRAFSSDVYLSSANAVSEDGEIFNIDGTGNRLAGTLFGHERVFIVAGTNKICPDFDAALKRARNTAAVQNAERLDKKTPCRIDGTCHDCHGREGICRALTVLWGPMNGMETEIVLIDGDWGL